MNRAIRNGIILFVFILLIGMPVFSTVEGQSILTSGPPQEEEYWEWK